MRNIICALDKFKYTDLQILANEIFTIHPKLKDICSILDLYESLNIDEEENMKSCNIFVPARQTD